MTDDQRNPSGLADLQRLAAACRAQVAHDPCDMAARMTLAWNLFFQALHQKHQQMFWNRVMACSERESESFCDTLRSLKGQTTRPAPEAPRLFRDCLMQASMVLQLSLDTPQRLEATKILDLAAMLGESQIVAEVEQEAKRILSRIARAVCAEKREKTRIPHRFREEDDLDW